MREDQAAGLRRLFAQRAARVLLLAESAWPRRGWLALNLAAAFSRAGEQVLVLDAERESVAGLWGARCRCELGHVLDGDRRLVDVVVPGPEASASLPMRRGGATLARQGRAGQRQLARVLDVFMEHDGLLVVPVSPAKLDSPVWRFGGGDLLLCIGDGPAATTDAYASIKVLLARRPQPCVRVALAGTAAAPARFEHLGCFAYSPEPDTPAYTLPGRVPARVHLFGQQAEDVGPVHRHRVGRARAAARAPAGRGGRVERG